MNKKKYNILIVITLIILLIWTLMAAGSYMKETTRTYKHTVELHEECLSQSPEKVKEAQDAGNPFCFPMSEKYYVVNFFSTLNEVLFWKMPNATYVFFFVVIGLSLYYTSRYLKYNILSLELTRNSYKKVKRDFFWQAYKPVLVIVAVIAVLFIISLLYFKAGLFIAPEYRDQGWSEFYYNYPIIFMIMYLLNVVMHMIVFINLSLIVVRKNQNYIADVILTILLFLGLEIFVEVVVEWFIGYILLKKEMSLMFNLLHYLAFNDERGIFSPFIAPSLFLVITGVMLHYLYKDKEKLVIDCEKNN